MSTTPNTQAEDAVLQLLKAAVPERGAEIDDLWRRYRPAVEVSEDARGTTMEATSRCIRFDHKTMRVLWLMGFIHWDCIALYSPAVVVSGLLALPIDAILTNDDERGPLEMEYRSNLTAAADLVAAKNAADAHWPEHVPEPSTARDQLASDQQKATFDLVCMATAFILLHELRHVVFAAGGNRPESALEEETQCDVWAREFMTAKIEEYSRSNNQPESAVRQKRAMALALGAAVLHELTPEHARWGSDAYPPIADRMHAIVSGMGTAWDSHHWLFAACLLVGIHRRGGRSLPMVATDNRVLVEELIEQLR